MSSHRGRRAPHGLESPGGLAAMYGSLAERCPLPVLVTQGDAHVIVYANPPMARLGGAPAPEFVGRPAAEALPRLGGVGGFVSLLDRVYATGLAMSTADLQRPEPSGQPANPAVDVWPTLDEQGRPTGLVVLVVDRSTAPVRPAVPNGDTAGLREINQALLISSVQHQELAEAARNAEAAIRASKEQDREAAILAERNRIAREIHDTLAQAFTGILLQLRVAQRIAEERPDEARDLIARVTELAQEGLAEARRSVWALQPEALHSGDLAGALSQTIDRISAGSPGTIEMHVHGAPRPLPPDVGLDLLRIGQEALTNALRHGQAQLIYVELTFAEERVLLTVQDDGMGFSVAQQVDGGGFGLVGMAQRAERLGGTLTIASQPGRGTEVSVSVPQPRQKPESQEP